MLDSDRHIIRKSEASDDYPRFSVLDEMLSSHSSAEIIKAKETIAMLCLDNYTEDLLELRNHPDSTVRYHILDALQYLSYEKDLTPILLDSMKDQDRISRLSADMLITTGSPSATPGLVSIIEDKESTAQEIMNTVRVLKEIGDERAVEPIIKLARTYDTRFPELKRKRVIEDILSTLGDIGSPIALPFVISYAEDDDERIRARVIEALGTIGGKKAEDTLIEMLRVEKEIKSMIVEALGVVGDESIAPLLHQYLGANRSSWLFSRTVIALGVLGSQKSFKPLWNAFCREPTEEISSKRGLITNALALINAKKLEKNLLSLLKSEDDELRRAVAEDLYKVSSPSSFDELISLLNSNDEFFRESISYAIFCAIKQSDESDTLISRVIGLLHSKDEHIREGLIFVAASLGGESAFKKLAALKDDSSFRVRKELSFVLRKVQTVDSACLLIELLGDDERDVREVSLFSLAALAKANIGFLSAQEKNILIPHSLENFFNSENHCKEEVILIAGHFWGEKSLEMLSPVANGYEGSRGGVFRYVIVFRDILWRIGTPKALEIISKMKGIEQFADTEYAQYIENKKRNRWRTSKTNDGRR